MEMRVKWRLEPVKAHTHKLKCTYKHSSHVSQSPTSNSSFNRSKILTDSVRLLKFSPGPTVTPRTGLPTTVVVDASVS